MKKCRVFFFILILLIFGAKSHAAVLLDRVVAVVNQDVITWGDLYKAMEFEATDKMRDLSADEKKKIFKENEGIFLDSLIDMKLQLQAAKQAGIEATAEEINDAIAGIKKKYSIDDAGLMESLKKEGFTLDEYKKKIAEQIALSRVVTQQVRNKIVVSDSEVNAYIKENKDLQAEGRSYRIRQIFFKNPAAAGDRKNVEEKANMVLQQLSGGEDFATLAKRYSEDSSAKTGGDLGVIKEKQMAKEFLDAISQMKTGDVSKPFWTNTGLHIVKLEEKREPQSEDELKESLRNTLLDKYFAEKYKNWTRGLRENAYIEIRL